MKYEMFIPSLFLFCFNHLWILDVRTDTSRQGFGLGGSRIIGHRFESQTSDSG